MPPCASSNFPGRAATAPVNAPLSWPKSSDSASDSGSAEPFTATNGPSARGLPRWIASATSSLPVPLSPCRSTVASDGATRPIFAKSARIGALAPTRPSERAAAHHLVPQGAVLGEEAAAARARGAGRRGDRLFSTGLRKKSKAPSSTARSAYRRSVSPVMTTTVASGRFDRIAARRPSPSSASCDGGRRRSIRKRSGSRATRASPATASGAVTTSNVPLRAQTSWSSRSAVVLDDREAALLPGHDAGLDRQDRARRAFPAPGAALHDEVAPVEEEDLAARVEAESDPFRLRRLEGPEETGPGRTPRSSRGRRPRSRRQPSASGPGAPRRSARSRVRRRARRPRGRSGRRSREASAGSAGPPRRAGAARARSRPPARRLRAPPARARLPQDLADEVVHVDLDLDEDRVRVRRPVGPPSCRACRRVPCRSSTTLRLKSGSPKCSSRFSRTRLRRKPMFRMSWRRTESIVDRRRALRGAGTRRHRGLLSARRARTRASRRVRAAAPSSRRAGPGRGPGSSRSPGRRPGSRRRPGPSHGRPGTPSPTTADLLVRPGPTPAPAAGR